MFSYLPTFLGAIGITVDSTTGGNCWLRYLITASARSAQGAAATICLRRGFRRHRSLGKIPGLQRAVCPVPSRRKLGVRAAVRLSPSPWASAFYRCGNIGRLARSCIPGLWDLRCLSRNMGICPVCTGPKRSPNRGIYHLPQTSQLPPVLTTT